MKFRLASDWKAVLRHAWSVRLLLVAGILSGLEVALPYLPALASFPVPFAILSLLVTAAAFVARLVAQKRLEEMPAPQRGVSFHDGDLVIYDGRLYRAVQPAEAA